MVNDIHSQLNRSEVREIVEVTSAEDVQEVVRRAGQAGLPVCIAGGRHAMGGQQFCAGGILIDTRGLDRVLEYDAEHGWITIEAGIQWPALLEYLRETPWAIAQK